MIKTRLNEIEIRLNKTKTRLNKNKTRLNKSKTKLRPMWESRFHSFPLISFHFHLFLFISFHFHAFPFIYFHALSFPFIWNFVSVPDIFNHFHLFHFFSFPFISIHFPFTSSSFRFVSFQSISNSLPSFPAFSALFFWDPFFIFLNIIPFPVLSCHFPSFVSLYLNAFLWFHIISIHPLTSFEFYSVPIILFNFLALPLFPWSSVHFRVLLLWLYSIFLHFLLFPFISMPFISFHFHSFLPCPSIWYHFLAVCSTCHHSSCSFHFNPFIFIVSHFLSNRFVFFIFNLFFLSDDFNLFFLSDKID